MFSWTSHSVIVIEFSPQQVFLLRTFYELGKFSYGGGIATRIALVLAKFNGTLNF